MTGRIVWWLRCSLLLLLPQVAAAQTAPDLGQSPPRVDEITAWLEPRLDQLETGEPVDVERARREILEPLLDADVSIDARIEVARIAMRRLERLVEDDDDHRATNALRVAGAIADQTSLRPLRAGLADDRASVRSGATMGAKQMLRVFEIEAPDPDARRSAFARDLQDDLLAALRAETNPRVAQQLVLALRATDDEAVRWLDVRAMDALGTVLVERAQSLRALPVDEHFAVGWDDALSRGIEGFQRRLRLVDFDNPPSPQFLRDAATVSGIALSMARDDLEARSGDDAFARLRELEALLIAAESVLIFAESGLTERTARPALLLPAVKDALAGEALVVDALDETDAWIDRLPDAPFRIPARQLAAP